MDNVSSAVFIKSQRVKVCFVKNGDSTFIELVMPTNEDSVVYNLLKRRFSYYHLGYKVKNLFLAVEELEQLNYKALKPFYSEAFEGRKCIFLHTPDSHLIELIEE
jgi:hypothetical protein